MISLLVVLGFSCALCLSLIPVARWLALRWGLVDQPDGHRKIHKRPTPMSGGLAIFISIIGSLGALLLMSESGIADDLWNHGQTLLALLLGALVICAVGVVDDLGRLRGRHKLLGQIAAATVVVSFGSWVRGVQLFGMEVDLGWFGIPFTIFFIVATINSLNLIDGMDGLLGSVGVVLSLSLATMACLAGHGWAAAIAMALAGALFGFLRYNLVRASIFLGDSGSMLVGFVLGALSIQCSLKAPSTLAIALPLGLLVLPIFDTAAAIIRRKLTGRSIYTTDRGHLHHCLQRSGFSNSGTVAVVALVCLVACGSVLASKAFDNEWITLITAAAIVATLVLTRLFGHAEAMLIKGRLWSLLSSASVPAQMEVRLQGTANWDHLWHVLRGSAFELNLKSMILDVNAPFLHEGYHARWGDAGDASEGRPFWQVQIPMTANGNSIGRLVLAGLPDAQPMWAKIATVMKVIEDYNATAAAPECLRETIITQVPTLVNAEVGLEAIQS